jgi:hypothetical protein
VLEIDFMIRNSIKFSFYQDPAVGPKE